MDITATKTDALGATGLNPGQMIITGFRGTKPSDPEVVETCRLIERGDISGVMLMKRNIESPKQLRELTDALHAASSDLPIIVSIDQEGGQVTRLGSYSDFLPWKSAADIAHSGWSDDQIFEYYAERVREMAGVGINLNFGPVVDLNVNPQNPIVGAKDRSYGRSVDDVVRFAEVFILAHRAAGVKTCLKHFPGHGSSFSDSHLGSTDISQTWLPEELEPFERLVRAGQADMIMNGHLLHATLSDTPFVPTSLSRKSAEKMREDLGFEGLIITDDMQMGAIADLMPPANASVTAALVGNDLLIYSNYAEQYSIQSTVEVVDALRRGVEGGILTEDVLRSRLERVRAFRSSISENQKR